jgi:nucleoside-diphosphate-sugar epimerase
VFNVACDEVVTVGEMAERIADAVDTWTVPLPLATPLLWPLCLFHQVRSWLTGNAGVLSLQKYAEIKAPGWVCDPGRLRRELNLRCTTSLVEGIAYTYDWYRKNQWL